jgi:hypothetical protein
MFTAAELAEIAAADAELERMPLTDEDYRVSDEIDKINADKNARIKKRKEKDRANYIKNRERRIAWQLEYYNAHKEHYSAQHHEYYLKNRERLLAAEKKRRMSK